MLNNAHLGRIACDNAAIYGSKPAFYSRQGDGKWTPMTWEEANKKVEQMAKSLLEYGVKPGDRVAIFSQNMVEIVIVDLALQSIRGVAVPMYATQSAEQVLYIVKDAEISLIFVGEQYQWEEVSKVIKQTDLLKKVVTIDTKIDTGGDPIAEPYATFAARGDGDEELEREMLERRKRLCEEDTAILIYTSGTTGEPKGVILTQANATEALRLHEKRIAILKKGYTSLCFLPLSHIFERGWTYVCMCNQMPIYINQNPKEVQKILKEVRPNTMCAVPRFWEKVYSGVQDKIEHMPWPLRKLTEHALKVGEKYNLGCRQKGIEPGTGLKMSYWFYDHTLFRILKKAVGLDRGQMFPCAGSACSEKVNIFIHSVGINLVIGYGLTETFATVSCNNCDNEKYDIHTVGEIMDNIKVRIDPETNEIQLKGKTITPGYYNKPEANLEAFTQDGYFRTGDAGRLVKGQRMDEIVMVERIKELYKTSNGKYIAPQQIEMLLDVDKYIEQSCIIADSRKYVTALIVPAMPQLKEFAAANGITYGNSQQLLDDPKVQELYTAQIAAAVAPLAAYEQVKYFTLLSEPFSMDNGELTNTLKMKRKVIYARYAQKIDLMYQH